mgnify:CR=1 FL=1|tara:strand:+ start:1774 stop:2436 length:663 start_codon:yes stop_codon:yes gene_type:complete
MLRNIYLKGELADVVGKSHWQLVCDTPAEAITGIDCQRDGKLLQYLRESLDNGLNFTMQRGEDLIPEHEAMLSLGKEDLIITPVPAGSKKGRKSVFWGTVLAVVGFMMGGPAPAPGPKDAINWQAAFSKLFLTVGIGMVQTGLAEMSSKEATNEEGALFNGPETTVKSGAPVPILYGQLEVGGVVGNFGFHTKSSDWYYTGVGIVGGTSGPGDGPAEQED